MKKLLSLSFIALAIAASFSFQSCQKVDPDQGSSGEEVVYGVTADKTTFSFDAGGGDAVVTVSADFRKNPLSVTGGAEWISYGAEKVDNETYIFSFHVKENSTGRKRTASFVLTNAISGIEVISITQDSASE